MNTDEFFSVCKMARMMLKVYREFLEELHENWEPLPEWNADKNIDSLAMRERIIWECETMYLEIKKKNMMFLYKNRTGG
ncbi:MAG TPA: hypothetical protein VJ583_05830 [Nitrososphaeraceae archaeon]|nr:hypothetical protein [Nitrososphaeraceae archaeon]